MNTAILGVGPISVPEGCHDSARHLFGRRCESKEERSARFEGVFRAHQAMAVLVHPVTVIVDELPIFEAHGPLHRVRVSGMLCLRHPHDDSGKSVSWKISDDDGEGKLERISVFFSQEGQAE